jgi:hypothetical protein
MTCAVVHCNRAAGGGELNSYQAKVSDGSSIDQVVRHVVVQRGTSQGAFENALGFEVSDFSCCCGEVGFNIGKVVSKALGIIGLAGNWKVAVYVVGVYAAAHCVFLVVDIYCLVEIAK